MNTALENLLRSITSDTSWLEADSGEVDAPTGWFGVLVITKDDVPNVRVSFDDADEVSDEDMIGNWLVQINSQGIIYVVNHDTQAEAMNVFDHLETDYTNWWNETFEG